MDKFLRPDKFAADPNEAGAAKQWLHWKRTFDSFLAELGRGSQNASVTAADKLNLLINYVAPSVYEFIAESSSYEAAISILSSVYIKPRNEIFARHVLASRRQSPGESLNQYLQALKLLAKDCDFKAVTAEEYRDDYIRDAFINGLTSAQIRQRLLESKTLDLQTAYEKAHTLEMAQQHSESFNHLSPAVNAAVPSGCDLQGAASEAKPAGSEAPLLAAASAHQGGAKCFFCGFSRHPRYKCPAKDALCGNCGKKGHYAKVCRSPTKSTSTSAAMPMLATISAASPSCLEKAVCPIKINGIRAKALIDTGSSESFVSLALVQEHKWPLQSTECNREVTMAATSLTSKVLGICKAHIELSDEEVYDDVTLSAMRDLCCDIILGQNFLKQHSVVEIPFGGQLPPLTICGLTGAAVPPPSLFANLTEDCKPVAVRSRRHSQADQKFISSEVSRLLKEGVIEPSNSPWRAQVLVTANENHKKRMVIDYSQTINRYTQLDAYPLPRIEEMVGQVAQYKFFSTLDLRSAYHQVSIKEEDKPYTAFEADSKLYQFKRIPFGITNGVASFQRIMDDLVEKEGLQDTFVYIDNVTVCGHTQEQHDENLKRFMDVVDKYNLTLNNDKSVLSARSVNLLGYLIENGSLKPDPARLRPFLELPEPRDTPSLKRVIGMFAHYSRWISGFSEKIHPLVQTTSFPLQPQARSAFEGLKNDIAQTAVRAIDPLEPFVVETDASDHAIAATLCQAGRPVAFFSRTLSPCEQRHSAVEKEAYAIVESLRHWRHYLIGRQFQLVTDQKSVAFMFDSTHANKIKNEKISRWRLELSCFRYDIIYRPGAENAAADALSRVCSSMHEGEGLRKLHDDLCHPGITRMLHFVRSRNLPYSVEDVRKMTNLCSVCAELKPRFLKSSSHLIKATQPFERLSLDFKGPLPSTTRNTYLLTIVDEFSRFPFAFPCPDMSATTIIKCLCQVFAIFGMPSFIHSDRGSAFMSEELKQFLQKRGIATSRTTPYNPQGNGQVERYNGIIWRTISLALKTRDLKPADWESVLPDALHSVRSLLSTATNCTPHERLFSYQRKSTYGRAIPTWLACQGKALHRRQVRLSKYDPLVDEVDVLDVNPNYAHVRFQDGRESTVSLRHLAPTPSGDDTGRATEDQDSSAPSTRDPLRQPVPEDQLEPEDSPAVSQGHPASPQGSEESTSGPSPQTMPSSAPCPQTKQSARQSGRSTRVPGYLKDYVRY